MLMNAAVGSRERRHRCRQIDPNNCTVQRDSLGKFQNSLIPATAYVEGTHSPECGASAAKARRPSGASCTSKSSRTSAHAPTRTSS